MANPFLGYIICYVLNETMFFGKLYYNIKDYFIDMD